MPRMKSYSSFDAYLADQSVHNQAIIRALRALINRVAPHLDEAVKWSNGCWVGAHGPVAYVHSDTDGVQFGFFAGSALQDPLHLLEGKGLYVRHIKVRQRSAIDEAAFAALVRQAAGGESVELMRPAISTARSSRSSATPGSRAGSRTRRPRTAG